MSDERIIRVAMGEEAAASLAKACGWAAARDLAILEDGDEHKGPAWERAQEAYMWLSWGERWLSNPDARVDYDKAMQDTIAELRLQLRTLEARTVEQRRYARTKALAVWRRYRAQPEELLDLILDTYEEAMR